MLSVESDAPVHVGSPELCTNDVNLPCSAINPLTHAALAAAILADALLTALSPCSLAAPASLPDITVAAVRVCLQSPGVCIALSTNNNLIEALLHRATWNQHDNRICRWTQVPSDASDLPKPKYDIAPRNVMTGEATSRTSCCPVAF